MNNRAENSHLPFQAERNTAPLASSCSTPNIGLSSIEMTCGGGCRAANEFATRFEILVRGNGTAVDRAPPTAIAVSRGLCWALRTNARACRHQSESLQYDCTKPRRLRDHGFSTSDRSVTTVRLKRRPKAL